MPEDQFSHVEAHYYDVTQVVGNCTKLNFQADCHENISSEILISNSIFEPRHEEKTTT